MAKVMISIPDQLLKRIDAYARSTRETRSGFLQRVAEREIATASSGRHAEIEELLDKATAPMGGNAVRLIREDRESH